MKIMSFDLGKSKTAVCVFTVGTSETTHAVVRTARRSLHDVLVEHDPDRVVMEISPTAGWVCDLCRSLGLEVQVANPNHEAWRWRNNRHKSDRRDAIKLAKLSAMDQLPTVHMPTPEGRAYRQRIRYRQSIVRRVTAIKNSIRALLTSQGLTWPAGKNGWTQKRLSMLREMSTIDDGVFWREMVAEELDQLDAAERSLKRITARLDEMGRTDERVQTLLSIPGVGPRLAETIAAVIDDPHRFRNGRAVGSYAGLTPRRYQSGRTDRQGRISGQGDRLLRAMLVEVSWLGLRHNEWMRSVYERALRGSPGRKKIAIVAVARRLLIRCWAMLRDGASWRDPIALRLAA